MTHSSGKSLLCFIIDFCFYVNVTQWKNAFALANAFLFLMARCNILYFTPLNCTVVKPPCERIFRFSIHTFYMGIKAWEIAMTAPVVMALLFPKVTNNTFETKWKLSSFVSCILNSFDALIIYTKSLKSQTSRVSLVIISLYTQDSFFPITKMYSKLFQFLSKTNLAQTRRKLE